MNRIRKLLTLFTVLLAFGITATAQTYLNVRGTLTVNEGASCITEGLNGNYYIAGYQGDSAVILEMQPNGTVLWERKFGFTTKNDRIYDLKLDSDNWLIGCGSGLASSGTNDDAFAFRWDPATTSPQWVRVENVNTRSRHYNITELPGGGTNFVLSGMNTATNARSNGHLIEVNRTTGVEVAGTTTRYWNSTGVTQADDFSSALMIGNDLVIAGRSVLNSGGLLDDSRGMISNFQVTGGGFGNVNWSRYYLDNLSTSSRRYNNDFIQVGNRLVACGFGDPLGASKAYQMHVIETDLSGVQIANRSRLIDLPDYTQELAREIVRISNGYIILGQAKAGGTGNSLPDDIVLLRLDNNFNVVWAHAFGRMNDDDFFANPNNQLVVDEGNDAIYFVGQSSTTGNSDYEMMIGRANMNGEIFVDGQPCFTILNHADGPEANFDSPFTWNTTSPTYTSTAGGNTTLLTTLLEEPACERQVEPCDVTAAFTWSDNNCVYLFNSSSSSAGLGTTIAGWSWTFGDGTSSTAQNPHHTYPGPGMYQVCLTVYGLDANGECCTSEYCDNVTVSCEPDPCQINPVFTWDDCGDTCALTFFGNYTFANRQIAAWFWDFGDGNTGTGQVVNHTYASSGTYPVTLTVVGIDLDGNCCTFTVTQNVSVFCPSSRLAPPGVTHASDEVAESNGDATQSNTASGIRSPGNDSRLKAYPNPGNGLFTVDLPAGGTAEVTVINTMGQLVWQQKGASNRLQLDLTDYPSGIYLIRVDGPNGLETTSVMKK